MNSFVRKYSAITGLKPDMLRSLFSFKPAIIGTNLKVNGADFNFYYSLHSIPTVGFFCSYMNKSIYFSGDTFYDPKII